MRNKYFIFLLFGLFSFASSQSEELSKFKEFSQKFEKAFFDSIDSKKVIDPTTLMPYKEGHFENSKLSIKENLDKYIPDGRVSEQAFISVNYNSERVTTEKGLANITSKLEAVGHSVTSSGQSYPSDVSAIDQLWDIRFANALSSSEITKLKTILSNGGTVYLLGEHSGFMTRNNSIISFIKDVGGGDVVYGGRSGTNFHIVESAFRSPNNVINIYEPASSYLSNLGNGTAISKTANGQVFTAVWNSDDLSASYPGKIVLVLGVNIFSTHMNYSSGIVSSQNNEEFLENIVGVMAKFADPEILSTSLASNNSYIDLTISEAVYNTVGGSGALEASDFTLTFAQNSGNATNASIISIKKNDNTAEASATGLSGGESVIRVFLSITGTPSGVETITITPLDGTSVYNGNGGPMAASETTGAIALNDNLKPIITGVTLSADNTTLAVTMSEAVFNTNSGSGALQASDFAFTISGGTATLGSATPTSINATGNVYTLGINLSGTSNGLDTLFVNPLDDSIFDGVGNEADSLQNNNLVLLNDLTAPSIISVSSSTADGLYKIGDEISIEVTFSESVIVNSSLFREDGTGRPRITLETGSIDQVINYIGGSGGAVLTWNYTVVSGNISSDLEYESTTALVLNSGTIKDATGNSAALTLPALGASGSLSSNKALVIDGIPPSIASSSLASDNSYVDLTISEAVYNTINGSGDLEASDFTLTFAQNSGNATSASIASMSALLGSETVFRISLNITGTPSGVETIAITPVNASSIYDLAGNVMPTSQENGIVTLKDKLAATIISVIFKGGRTYEVTFGDSVYGDCSRSALEVEDFVVETVEEYNHTNIFSSPASIAASGNTYSIVISTTNNTLGSEQVKINLADNSVYDANCNESIMAQSNNIGYLPDETPPEILSVTLASNNSSIAVTMTESSYNTNGGSGALQASDFSFTINGGVATLSSVTPTSISANGTVYTLGIGLSGTPNGNEVLSVNPVDNGIYDLTGNESAIFQTNNSAFLNDNINPIITSVSLASNNTTLAVTMSEAVYNTDGGSGALEAADFVFSISLGDATLSSTTPTSISKSGNVYTLGVGLSGTANGAEVLVVNPVDNSIYDLVGNEASSSQSNNRVNLNSKIVPIITSIALASDNSSAAVTFSEAVYNATGGSGALQANDFVLSITGGNATLGSATPTGISISSNTYTLSFSLSGTPNGSELLVVNPKDDSIYDANNNEASTSQSNNSINLNDLTVPTVTSVTSTTANGTYGVGNIIQVTTIFGEEVFVTGTPQITLETGSTDATVNYSSGSGSNTLVFNYTVSIGHISSDLDYMATTSLTLNSGTIKDAAGNVATLTLASPAATYSLGANKAIVIDGSVPTITAINSSTANGTYSEGDTIAINIIFSESVTVNSALFEDDGRGRPRLTLETGLYDQKINYSSGSPNDTLTWSYVVAAGNNSNDLDFLSTSALVLNGGTIKDVGGNNGTLTLPTPGGINSLSANKNLVIDTQGPTVVFVSSTTDDGAHNLGDTINVTVTFSEAVVVTGNPHITLETGSMDRGGEYYSGTNSTTLLFRYIVKTGDQSSDLSYVNTSSLILNAGTIKDAKGNFATLTLPTPGATNSLSANKAIVIDNIVPLMDEVAEGSLVSSVDLDYQSNSTNLNLSWKGSDNNSGINNYEYALGTSKGGTETINWVNSSSSSISLASLSLTEATKYYASVRATDKAGNVSAVMTGDGITIDISSPILGTVNDGLSADIAYTSALNSLSANWSGFSDAVSGIANYHYAIGTELDSTDVKGWTSNGLDTSFTFTGYELINTQVYYVSVKAIDEVGNISDTVSSNGVISDQENPMAGLVVDGKNIDAEFTNTDTIYANWSGFADSLSGISRYEFALGTSPGSIDMIPWTDNGNLNKTSLSILLKDETIYYVSVRAIDMVGNASKVATSNGIVSDFVPPKVISVLPDEDKLLYLLYSTTINFSTSEPITNSSLDVSSRSGAPVDFYIDLNDSTAIKTSNVISITINKPLVSDDQILIKIDSLKDQAGNISNGLVFNYDVSLLGDYDMDGDISITDLTTFINGWNTGDISLELGPAIGTVPNLKPVIDGKYDTRDMMAFTRMWHWDKNKLSKQHTKMIAVQGEILNAVIEPDHIVFNPPKGTKSVELILDYPPMDIQFDIAQAKSVGDEGLALSNMDTLNGRIVYQVGYFEENNEPIRINTKHLQKNDIGVNLTYQFIGEENIILSAGSEVMDITPVPSEFALHDNYPNPFNPITTINYDLPKDAYVNLVIYDIMGREVANLASKEMSAGFQTMTWNARNNAGAPVSAGIYFYQIQTHDFVKTKKMVLLK